MKIREFYLSQSTHYSMPKALWNIIHFYNQEKGWADIQKLKTAIMSETWY